jgi:hypothetical protein
LLRSDRLLELPPADRQSCGCSPAIEGIIAQYPPNTRGFPRHMNGKRRSSSSQPNVGIRGKIGGSRAAKPGRRAVMIYGRWAEQFARIEWVWVAHTGVSEMADAASGCMMPETA